MKDRQNIIDVAALGSDYLGFIFYSNSPRYLDDLSVLKAVPLGVKKVAVFVNAPLEAALQIVADYDFDAVQLHGAEKPDYCSLFKSPTVEVIKAFGVDEQFDFSTLKRYKDACDSFLFDAQSVNHGGTGNTFNWSILNSYNENKPFFLSGGIGFENLPKVVELVNSGLTIYGIDLNSRLEIQPGLKNVEKVKESINYLKVNHLKQ